jgi:DNA helicase-2/ATP-dependent DNA helicase PcrA
MSDDSVHSALRSPAQLVVIEAPAGCGKTHQGAEYARELATAEGLGRPLILTHTHAACSIFADRTSGTRTRVDIRTIDSIIGQVASAYHSGLGLPADTAAWLRQRGETGYQELAFKVATLLRRRPMIAAALARRHPVVICDEHQDSSGDQHTVVMALHEQGSRLRMFADPMQKIFRNKMPADSHPPCEWDVLCASAGAHETLDYPHRWKNGCPKLGQWTLDARETLKTGGKIDLRDGLPPSVRVVFAENKAKAPRDYQLDGPTRKPVDSFQKAQSSLLILTRYNDTARSLRAFFGREISLWEGYTRPGLDKLVSTLADAGGNPAALAAAVVTFMDDVGKGFSPSAFGNVFIDEASEGCTKKRKGKPALIQELARHLVDDPSHRGVARMLDRLSELKAHEPAFKDIEMDCYREFRDAIRLGAFDAPDTGLAEITHRRTYSRPKPPPRAISIIHKAKGLECESVVVMPCDKQTFPDKPDARCLLYVALSRATSRLMLVVSNANPSPLLII